MAECEVVSPVARKGSKVGSGQPVSPGARSNPSHDRTDSIPARWSERPQRGAGRANDYRARGVRCGPLDQDTSQAERRNLRVHSV
jgi:hypothetical protein